MHAEGFVTKPFVLYATQNKGTQALTWITLIYQDLFKRMNIPLNIIYATPQRSSVDADSGKVDGQFPRIFTYQNRHPNQVRVDEAIIQGKIMAFVNRSSNYVFSHSWDSFKNSGLKVEYVKGIVISKKNLEKTVPKDKLFAISGIKRGLRKLVYQRTDVFVHGAFGVIPMLNDKEFKGKVMPAGVMKAIKLYPYINIKYKGMLPLFEKTIKEMKAEGVIKKYCEQVFSSDAASLCADATP